MGRSKTAGLWICCCSCVSDNHPQRLRAYASTDWVRHPPRPARTFTQLAAVIKEPGLAHQAAGGAPGENSVLSMVQFGHRPGIGRLTLQAQVVEVA